MEPQVSARRRFFNLDYDRVRSCVNRVHSGESFATAVKRMHDLRDITNDDVSEILRWLLSDYDGTPEQVMERFNLSEKQYRAFAGFVGKFGYSLPLMN